MKKKIKKAFPKAKWIEVKSATNTKFKKAKKVLVKKASAQKKVIKNFAFKSNKTYYVRVRAYKKIGKTKYYGKYSTVKKIVGK